MTEKFMPMMVPITEVPFHDEMEKYRQVVLVVDDERIIADTLSVILTNNGFAALAAYSGKGALEIAKTTPPDLLISDVVMPGMTGVELAIALVKEVPDCKVLLFSGQASTVDLLAEARAAGHDFSALAKPIHPKDLLARVSRCLEEARPGAVCLPA